MKTISKNKSITASFVMFILVILMLIFVASPIQMTLGMTGVLLTELILLAMAIVGTLAMKGSFKEVFPIKAPKIKPIFGTILMWIGSYFVILFSTLLIGFLFPETMSQVSTGMNSIMTSVPLPIRFLIVALSPAICEEAVHRGFILHYLKPLNKKWLIVLVMGILFGAFHLDPMRFLATGILGAVITYIALETENIIYPVFLHLLHNSLSVLATKATEGVDLETTNTMAYTLPIVGAYMIFMCISPWLIWAGASLLRPKNTEKKVATWKKVLVCTIVSLVCIIGGVALTTIGTLGSAKVNVSESTTIGALQQQPYTHEFDIENTGVQQLAIVVSTLEGSLDISITDSNENVVYETSTTQFSGSVPLNLSAGHYTLKVEFSNEDGDSYTEDSPVLLTFMLLQL